MPPTHTVEGLAAAHAIRRQYGAAVGILVLSHHVEARYAIDLLSDGSGGLGYLLKDHVLGPAELADAIRRVGNGGTAIDPQVIEHLHRPHLHQTRPRRHSGQSPSSPSRAHLSPTDQLLT